MCVSFKLTGGPLQAAAVALRCQRLPWLPVQSRRVSNRQDHMRHAGRHSLMPCRCTYAPQAGKLAGICCCKVTQPPATPARLPWEATHAHDLLALLAASHISLLQDNIRSLRPVSPQRQLTERQPCNSHPCDQHQPPAACLSSSLRHASGPASRCSLQLQPHSPHHRSQLPL